MKIPYIDIDDHLDRVIRDYKRPSQLQYFPHSLIGHWVLFGVLMLCSTHF